MDICWVLPLFKSTQQDAKVPNNQIRTKGELLNAVITITYEQITFEYISHALKI